MAACQCIRIFGRCLSRSQPCGAFSGRLRLQDLRRPGEKLHSASCLFPVVLVREQKPNATTQAFLPVAARDRNKKPSATGKNTCDREKENPHLRLATCLTLLFFVRGAFLGSTEGSIPCGMSGAAKFPARKPDGPFQVHRHR